MSKLAEKTNSSFFFSEDSYHSKKNQCPQLSIERRFYFKTMVANYGAYHLYKGVDVHNIQWVHIYGRRADNPNAFTAVSINENKKNQLCPKLLWSGQVKTSKLTYFFQVHEKYGPSLATLFQTIKRGPKEKEILHLLLQMIKLIEKMNALKLVCGQLDPETIVFDASPSRKELYLLNSFRLRKKMSIEKPMKTKYCSRGAHLGRSLNTKDDLQSICYILIDLFMEGAFLAGKKNSQYQQIKLSGKIETFAQGLPPIFVQFYHYIISLNLTDQINFFYWKTYLSRIVSTQVLHQPYSFMVCKRETTNLNDVVENIAKSQKDVSEEIEEQGDEEGQICHKIRRYTMPSMVKENSSKEQ